MTMAACKNIFTRAIFLLAIITRDAVVGLPMPTSVVTQVRDSDSSNDDDPGKFLEQRNVGAARHWLQTSKDSGHVENGSHAGVHFDHAEPVAWGERARDDTVSLLPGVGLPSLPKVGHIEDPPFMKAIKDFLGRKR